MQSETKKISHIPNGFTAVTPYFQVADGERFLQFLKDAFGCDDPDVHREDGTIRHFAVKVYGAMIEGSQVALDGEYPPNTLAIHLYVKDSDEVYAKSIAAGGESIHEVADMPYGERSGAVKDPCGNHWYIATQKVDMYPEH
ncbi:MAG: VOC family protein [Pyrinomonadaceae bacterium]|nr:VOC family protein [Pyrinomonadaceae bacterium]